MTIEQQLRDRLARATHDVIGGPDLDVCIRDGGRRRRTRRRVVGLGAAAVVGVGALGLGAVLGGHHGSPTTTSEPAASVPKTAPQAAPKAAADPSDWVPGTDTDQKMAAAIAADVPSLPTPDDVYPSDAHTAGAMPDADWPKAQDWQAYYKVAGGSSLIVMMAVPNETPSDPFSCSQVTGSAIGVHADQDDKIISSGPTGTLCTQRSQTSDDGASETQWGTWFQRADGSVVAVLEYDPASAGDSRAFSQDDLNKIAQDPTLVCPPPSA